MKISKALKVKNRLAGKLARIQSTMKSENSSRSDNPSKINHAEVWADYHQTLSDLITIRGRIAVATAPIAGKLVALSETKSQITFFNQMYSYCREGEEKMAYGDQVETYRWDSFKSKLELKADMEELQAVAESLQDEIDEFNGMTDI